jgi:hypothetical protein
VETGGEYNSSYRVGSLELRNAHDLWDFFHGLSAVKIAAYKYRCHFVNFTTVFVFVTSVSLTVICVGVAFPIV